MVNIREIVLNILMEYDKKGVYKPAILKDSLEKYDYLETRDKAFIKRVTDGCLERKLQIDYILDQFSKTPVNKMQPLIRSLLRMSVYQIMFMDQVPDSAACNEAVKLAAKHKFAGLKGFVNGVLRNISRNKDKIEYPDIKKDGGAEYLSVYYSMPRWICDMWLTRFGLEKTKAMLEFFLQPRPTIIRVKTENREDKKLSDDKLKAEHIKQAVDSLKKQFEDAGAVVQKNEILPFALELEKIDNIRFLPGYDEGLFTVQDVSSMLVTEIADPKPGENVIDICSAPGGKTTHAAERVKLDTDRTAKTNNEDTAVEKAVLNDNSGVVLARDVSERKCDLIRENAERLQLSNIMTEVHDARIHDENLEGKADILYMDLPCSGLGIIGRKGDIKYNASPKSLSEVEKLQWEIIKSSWDYVKPGGILMYSTCTVNQAENEKMVERIIEQLPFERVDITDKLPKSLTDKTFGSDSATRIKNDAKHGFIQLLPGECGTDGFFIAKLKRV
ncbi:MAG: 16S rRNA (cytosine(967)-C(5))-methyltransferase RsmB [Butyrivibrio sp.]|nr:16S rRNA (cytosine(967)-C(5))-methyltransferase RsmB [Butyrivibrio sp.]